MTTSTTRSTTTIPGSGLPNAGYNPNRVNHAPPFNEFTRDAKRFHGGYSRILDAYGYTSFNLGEQSKLNLRAGRHVVSWGEAIFFPGISLAQGPADGTKTGVPGTETKDQLLPEDQLSVLARGQPALVDPRARSVQLPPNARTRAGLIPELLRRCRAGRRLPRAPGPDCRRCRWPSRMASRAARSEIAGADILPGKTGQWGLGTRYRVTDETEVGLYYLNYHDRTPLPEINAFTPGTVTPAFFNIPGQPDRQRLLPGSLLRRREAGRRHR
jgi:hypothetical protein